MLLGTLSFSLITEGNKFYPYTTPPKTQHYYKVLQNLSARSSDSILFLPSEPWGRLFIQSKNFS